MVGLPGNRRPGLSTRGGDPKISSCTSAQVWLSRLGIRNKRHSSPFSLRSYVGNLGQKTSRSNKSSSHGLHHLGNRRILGAGTGKGDEDQTLISRYTSQYHTPCLPARPCCRTHTQALALHFPSLLRASPSALGVVTRRTSVSAVRVHTNLTFSGLPGTAALVPPLPITPAAGGERRAGRPSAQGAAGGAEP